MNDFNYDGDKIDKIYYRLKELGYDVTKSNIIN